MKKYFIILVSMFICGLSYAGGVQSDNIGNQGNIFVATGEVHGAESVGHWTDASNFKGEKGDTGAQGIAGRDGRDGVNGINGRDGNNGLNGRDGLDGKNGRDGVDGKNGLKGDQGIQGVAGKDGIGKDGTNGLNGLNGLNGINGANGKDVDPAVVNAQNDKLNNMDKRLNKMENTQSIVVAEVRIFDSRKWTITSFVDVNTTRVIVDRCGVKFTFKAGSSYEERRLAELEAKIEKLTSFSQGKEETPRGEFYTQGSAIGYRQSF